MRLLVYDAARRKEAGVPLVKEAAMAKLLASEVSHYIYAYTHPLIYIYINISRLLVYDAARRKEAGVPLVKEAAMAKLLASKVNNNRYVYICGFTLNPSPSLSLTLKR